MRNAYDFDGVHNLRLKTMQVDEYSMSKLVGGISKIVNEIEHSVIY